MTMFSYLVVWWIFVFQKSSVFLEPQNEAFKLPFKTLNLTVPQFEGMMLRPKTLKGKTKTQPSVDPQRWRDEGSQN